MKMTRYFMAGTHLAGLEIMMMTPPNFLPRGTGVKHRYPASECACRNCIKAEKRKRPCRRAAECCHFDERLVAGCWSHGELAEKLTAEIQHKGLLDRTRTLLPPQTASPFADEAHRKRTVNVTAGMTREQSPFTSAVFLLSADLSLWRRSRQGIVGGAVDFGRVDTHDIGQDSRALLQTAKDLYHGGCRLTPDMLCNPRVIRDRLFRLIVSGFVIRRYGLPAESL
jgi:hypothetical protein